MPTPTVPRNRCWIWFIGNPLKDEALWRGGWLGSISPVGGVKIEHPDYVHCRVPSWRVLFQEPKGMKKPPDIPEDAKWKLFPVE